MTNSRKWFLGLASGLLVAAIAFGGISLATVSSAQAAESVITQRRGGPGIPGEPDGRLFPGLNIDYDALLADALGISVDELEAARLEANQAAIDLAIEEGLLTEDEAALMYARLLVKDGIDPQALSAEALGMSTEELQTALDDGQTMQDLLTENELSPAAYREAYQVAYENALQALVDQGVITAEQAELLLDQPLLSGLRGAFTDMDGSFRDKGFRAP
jgi:hypothetical protein